MRRLSGLGRVAWRSDCRSSTQPVCEARSGDDGRAFIRQEAVFRHPASEVGRVWISDDFACFAPGVERAPDRFAESQSLRPGDLQGAVRFAEDEVGQFGCDFVRCNGANANRCYPYTLGRHPEPVDIAEVLEELGRPQKGVRNQ